MKLDSKTYSTSNEHHGNNKAIMCEAMEERWSSDPDLNRDLTQYNVYGGYNSGLELLNDINHEIEDLSASLREQGKRGIRKDAITSFAVIIKPDTEIMENLTREQQMQFFRDAFNIVSGKFGYNQQLNKPNVRAFSIHFDEGNPHMHLFGVPYTKDGRLSAKEIFTPQLSRWFNEEFPELMNQRGWNLEACKDPEGYDPDKAKTMDEQQLKEYKEQCIKHKKAKKKQRGKTSREFKEAKDKARELQDWEQNLEAREAVLEASKEEFRSEVGSVLQVLEQETERALQAAKEDKYPYLSQFFGAYPPAKQYYDEFKAKKEQEIQQITKPVNEYAARVLAKVQREEARLNESLLPRQRTSRGYDFDR